MGISQWAENHQNGLFTHNFYSQIRCQGLQWQVKACTRWDCQAISQLFMQKCSWWFPEMQLHSQIPRQVRSKQGFFEQKVKDFWSEPTHLNNRFHDAVIGPFLAEFLCPCDVSKNEKARYIFSIGWKDFEICLATLTCIFGLDFDIYIAARKIFNEKEISWS